MPMLYHENSDSIRDSSVLSYCKTLKDSILDLVLPQICLGCFCRLDSASANRKNAVLTNLCTTCFNTFRGKFHEVSTHQNCFALTSFNGAARAIINHIKEENSYELLEKISTLIIPQMCEFILEHIWQGGLKLQLSTLAQQLKVPGNQIGFYRHNMNSQFPITIIPAPSRREQINTNNKTSQINIAFLFAQAVAQQLSSLCVFAPIFGLLPSAKDSTGLNSQQRKNNIAQNLYSRLSQEQIVHRYRYSVVIVLDDIITSGATYQGVTQALSSCGVRVNAVMALCSN